ncbi:hypothetical protein LQ327_00640 [Actinomycetospora endophytica]|uniref:Sigma-54 interacting transcriptional regulator n=1 Tax=Actinomycetospora endophytica TaxID=2291215 RepID=A0ABS8P0X4_9PSEU|nr:hypothetical protein [Actinomycetospora endophytica]MCD2191896.1 hypothetical protein [Actinomycetospora endophytica]
MLADLPAPESATRFATAAWDVLMAWHWPGNLAELHTTVVAVARRARGGIVDADDPRPAARAVHPSRVGTYRVRPTRTWPVCLLIILLILGPRAVIVVWWLIAPLQWSATFGTLLWPIIGFLILPWTTLVYMLVAPGGVVGLDYLWLALAVLVDVSSHAGGRVYQRRRSATA